MVKRHKNKQARYKEGLKGKVKMLTTKTKFEKLAKEIETRFKAKKIMQKTVNEAIHWARKNK